MTYTEFHLKKASTVPLFTPTLKCHLINVFINRCLWMFFITIFVKMMHMTGTVLHSRWIHNFSPFFFFL